MAEMTTGKRLAVARKAAGFRSQESLGDQLGVSARMVRYWEAGTYPVPLEHRETITRLLGSNIFVEGDAVEIAIAQSELVDWRQDAVRSVYRKNLAEQREGRAG